MEPEPGLAAERPLTPGWSALYVGDARRGVCTPLGRLPGLDQQHF